MEEYSVRVILYGVTADKEILAARRVLDDDVDYMFNLIKRICIEVGPGIPCSPQEAQRASVIKSEMEAILGTDRVEVEQAVLAPKAFFGWYRWGSAVTIASLSLFFIGQLSGSHLLWTGLSLVCILPVTIITIGEFLLYRELIDPFFRKGTSQNIIGRIRRSGDTAEPIERLLIVSGHHDSAIEFNWITYTGFGYYIVQLLGVFSQVSILVSMGAEFYALGWLGRSLPWVEVFVFWITISLVPLSFIAVFFFLGPQTGGGTVPGAVDNLSACAIALAVGRMLTRRPELIPPHTEIRLISFGSEEAATRGAMRYVERHIEELKRLDARVCNLDTVIDPTIVIFTSDGNGFTSNIPEGYEALARAASAAGVPHALKPFPTLGGATDALPFSRHGIKAATLFAMRVPEQMVRWYHTPRDTYTLFQKESEGGTRGLRNALLICLEWITQSNC